MTSFCCERTQCRKACSGNERYQSSCAQLGLLGLELSDALLRPVSLNFVVVLAREQYRYRKKVTTVAVCFCCQLAACCSVCG